MSNSELFRIKNKQKTPYKNQKTVSSFSSVWLWRLVSFISSNLHGLGSCRFARLCHGQAV